MGLDEKEERKLRNFGCRYTGNLCLAAGMRPAYVKIAKFGNIKLI